MNKRQLLGTHCPAGTRCWAWNLAVGEAVAALGVTSGWNHWIRGGHGALLAVPLFPGAAAVAHFPRKSGPAVP